MSKKSGFTLAEILIVFLITGIIAALAIPPLINNVNNIQYATKLKKEYSVLQQALDSIVADAGGSIMNDPNFNCSGTITYCRDTVSVNAVNELATKISLLKNCGNGTGCWYSTNVSCLGKDTCVYNPEGNTAGIYGKAVLTDGTVILLFINNTNCTNDYGAPANSPAHNSVCGVIHMDINGAAGPNKMGKDYFCFYITRDGGLYPWGPFFDNFNDCNPAGTDSGWGCAAKVLSEGAINY